MPNDVEIVVRGKDQSQAAVDSAKNNVKRAAVEMVAANLRVEKATAAVTAAVEKFGSESLQAREASQRLAEAHLRQEEAARKAAAAERSVGEASEKVRRDQRAAFEETQRVAAAERDAAESAQRLSREQRGAAESAQRMGSAERAAARDTEAAAARSRAAASSSDSHSASSRRLAGALSAAGVAARAGLSVGLIAVGAAAVSTIRAGVDYQNQLNTMQAVTHATSATMAEVARKARDLGNDLTLPATSAGDAAQAMTELAKGNLTAQQAMDAAKGTLQLAAAAQISGAAAAKIQADALGAFSLKAGQAGHVADLLANAANSATGEISDFALGLSQSSAVAHQFGISVDDTVTALALFANAGIHGSDAGTSLKSALLALASPSAQARKALDVLRLSAFDAHGNFVGLESISQQLATAQGRLSKETFVAATSTAFGSDAARAAGVLAANGAAGWDKMAASIGRSGGAATAAAAKTKGLGGAWAGLKSQLETIQIDVFTAAAPALERFVGMLSSGLPKAISAVKDGFRAAAAPAAALAAGAKDVSGFLGDMGGAAKAAADGLKPMGAMLGEVGDMAPFVADTTKSMKDGIKPIGGLISASAAEGRRAGLHRLFYDIGNAVGQTVVFIRRNMPTWKQWGHVASEAARLVGDALGAVGGFISGTVGPAMAGLIGWVNRNRFAFAVFGAEAEAVLLRIGGNFLIMAGYAVKGAGLLIGAWDTMLRVILTVFGTIIHGAAAAFGWIHGVGDDLKTARDGFDKFAAGVHSSLSAAAKSTGQAGDALIGLGHRTVEASDKAVALRKRMSELRSRALTIQAIDRASVVAARIRAGISQVKGKRVDIIVTAGASIQHIQREINELTGKAISVQVGPVRGPGPAWKAAGGIVGADTGGARGGLTWVGEAGRELVRLPYGSTVYPHGQSEAMAGGSGGGGNTYNIAVTVAPGGHPADVGGKIVDLIRRYEQRSGHAWRTA